MPRRIFILLCDTGRRVDRFPVPLLQRFEHWATMPTEQALRNMQVIDRVMILQVVPSRLFQLFESSHETCRKVARAWATKCPQSDPAATPLRQGLKWL